VSLVPTAAVLSAPPSHVPQASSPACAVANCLGNWRRMSRLLAVHVARSTGPYNPPQPRLRFQPRVAQGVVIENRGLIPGHPSITAI